MNSYQQPSPGMNPIQQMRPTQPDSTQQNKQRNVVGIIGLVCAIAGLVFSCIPGALIVGWVLLPIGFILGLVGLFLAGKKKGTSIAAVIVSVVGTVLAVAVFAFVVVDSFDEAFNGDGDVSVSGEASDSSENQASADGEDAGGENASGSRENPAAIGQVLSNDNWDLTVNSFNPNATAEVSGANPFNEAPEPGHQYAVANLTFTYKGEGSELVDMLPVAFVAENGTVSRTFDSMAVPPEPALSGEVYAGGEATGNVVLQIPEGQPGVLRIELGMFGDEVFVATN